MATMAQLLPQIALEAASASRLQQRRYRNDTLTSRVQSNDPTLLHLKLCRKPASLFDHDDDVDGFLRALTQNHTITSVELSWRFLSALSPQERIQLMGHLGSLPNLEKLYMEAIGPCDALVAALSKTSQNNQGNFKSLWIGALRLSSSSDVQKLTTALSGNVSLMQFNLNNIRLQTQGSYRVDDQGMVWFQENETNSETMIKLDINPLLRAVASIPSMKKIQLELQLNPMKMVRISKTTLQCILQQTGLTFLMLSSCDLDDDDIAIIAEQMQSNHNNNLETLNLYRNTKITEIGWRILAQMLETNYSLMELFTPETGLIMGVEPPYQTDRFRRRSALRNAHLRAPALPPSQPTRKKMDILLRLNQRGRKQLLCDPTTTRKDWIDFLASEVDYIDMSFYVLQAAPGLFVA